MERALISIAHSGARNRAPPSAFVSVVSCVSRRSPRSSRGTTLSTRPTSTRCWRVSSDDIELAGSEGAAQGLTALREWATTAAPTLVPGRMFMHDGVVVVEEQATWSSEPDVTKSVATAFRVVHDQVTAVFRHDTLEEATGGHRSQREGYRHRRLTCAGSQHRSAVSSGTAGRRRHTVTAARPAAADRSHRRRAGSPKFSTSRSAS